MRLLLDTHVWLWLEKEPSRVGSTTLGILEEPNHELLLSSASVWEIVIKSGSGKLNLTMDAEIYVRSRLTRSRIAPLPIAFDHVLAIGALPKHHADPFDRVLLAQAQVEGLTLVTADAVMQRYDILMLDALR